MKISNEFTVHTPIDKAWAVLTDLEGIAPCLPGAQLTGVDGDVYAGKVKIKVGPVISDFTGTARFVEKDDTAYRAVIDAKGKDSRSAGNASAVITAGLRPDGDATVVSVDTDLKISGKLAQFGSGMIKEVSGKLLTQFAEALETKISAGDAVTSPPTTSATPSTSSAAPSAPSSAIQNATSPAPSSPSSAPSSTSPTPSTTSPAPSSDSPALFSTSPTPSTSSPAPSTTSPAADDSANSTQIAAADTSIAVATSGAESGAFPGEFQPVIKATPEVGGPSAAVDAGEPATQPAAEPATQPAAEPAAQHPAEPATQSGTKRTFHPQAEPEPLDLMEYAGGSIRRRLIPVAIGAAALVAAVLVYRVARR